MYTNCCFVQVGVLIGKAGDTIRTLQNSSGARIQITRDAEADPNSATRTVQLIGSIESINKAERLIKEVIAEVSYFINLVTFLIKLGRIMKFDSSMCSEVKFLAG